MSRLIDKLKQKSPEASSPMGFRAAPAAAPLPKMLLIASLGQADSGDAAGLLEGADAGLFPVLKLAPGVKAIQELSRAVPDIPWGGWLKDASLEGVSQLADAGGDYVVFPVASAVLPDSSGEGPGRVLEIETSLEESLLRAVNRLPVDAVLIMGELPGGRFLTWHDVLNLQRCAGLISKPLLVLISSGITATELQVLLDAGVDGVVVAVEAGQPAGRLKELRQMIASLIPPSKHQRENRMALLPHISGGAGVAAEEPEEE